MNSADLVDPLDHASAGGAAIRGGAVRTGGYVVGTALAAITSVFLLRYLGVAGFGYYVTVTSLVAVVAGLTDAGLALVGQREYVNREREDDRRALVADIIGIRLLLTPLGVALAALFAALAGYGRTLVLGTVLVGAGLVLANVSLSLTVPLAAKLRFGAITTIEMVRQVATVVGVGLLVMAGAGLLPMFAVHLAAGLAALVVTVRLVGSRAVPRPRISPVAWRPILIEAGPVAVALALSVLYLRVLLLMMSLLSTDVETGLYATSYRILEILAGVPALMLGAAFPILARAGAGDHARLRYALQRLVEVTLVIAVGLVMVIVIGADSIVRLLGGADYADAARILQIQSFALLAAFVGVVWMTGLVAMKRQTAVVVTNAAGLVAVLVLGSTLIPSLDAEGAAVAAVLGEAVIAAVALVMLHRAGVAAAPRLVFLARLGAAAAGGIACSFVPAVPELVAAAFAGLAYTAGAWATGAVPAEAVDAFLPARRRKGEP